MWFFRKNDSTGGRSTGVRLQNSSKLIRNSSKNCPLRYNFQCSFLHLCSISKFVKNVVHQSWLYLYTFALNTDCKDTTKTGVNKSLARPIVIIERTCMLVKVNMFICNWLRWRNMCTIELNTLIKLVSSEGMGCTIYTVMIYIELVCNKLARKVYLNRNKKTIVIFTHTYLRSIPTRPTGYLKVINRYCRFPVGAFLCLDDNLRKLIKPLSNMS